ncbi:PREDICTED: kelch domain-containing protein 10 homolog isoform X2 [Polistes canadensis]|uniref:kelch domain-containing protein 10 homolog isoform X2 n=1 Tax=Polistes canadensis TaxID=91411 RepID=UPI000718E7DE|nr:PREDICTED: kelch domain-containing protein 10 homolog isoform X2 [Polistes canadensis]
MVRFLTKNGSDEATVKKMYVFKPFVIARHRSRCLERPKARSGHRIVCDHKNLYSYGGFNPCITDYDRDMRNDGIWLSSKPLFKEIWKFNLATNQWKRLPGRENLPDELASNAVVLKGNALIVYGGTGVPFGDVCNGQLYVCNVNDGKTSRVVAKGDMPKPQYGQALLFHKPYLYTVGGTTGREYTCDIHRFNFETGLWEKVYICTGKDLSEPMGRYRHELGFDGKNIYVIGGGTGTEAFSLAEIPTFNLEKRKWTILNTQGDSENNTIPAPRRCHGVVQYMDEKTGVTYVVVSGGTNGAFVFSDVWRLDLSEMQWTCLKKCKLPRPLFFHSAALTPQGRMYTFGGVSMQRDKAARTDAVYAVWLTIPKLSEICWLALNYYISDLRNRSPDKLLNLGIPLKFVQRLDPCI